MLALCAASPSKVDLVRSSLVGDGLALGLAVKTNGGPSSQKVPSRLQTVSEVDGRSPGARVGGICHAAGEEVSGRR